MATSDSGGLSIAPYHLKVVGGENYLCSFRCKMCNLWIGRARPPDGTWIPLSHYSVKSGFQLSKSE